MSKKNENNAQAKHIAVTKDGDTMDVHPSQVEQHQRLGWSVVAPAEEAGEES